jgi:hypothetical protein
MPSIKIMSVADSININNYTNQEEEEEEGEKTEMQ